MYWLDTAILAALGLGAGLGLINGFLWQVARLLSLSLALAGTLLGNAPVAELLHEHLLNGADPRVSDAVAYVVTFLAIYLSIFYLARMLRQATRASELEVIDRLLGAAIGAAKIGLILAAFCLAAANYPHPTTREWMQESTLAPALATGMESILLLIPEEDKDNLRQTLAGVGELFSPPKK